MLRINVNHKGTGTVLLIHIVTNHRVRAERAEPPPPVDQPERAKGWRRLARAIWFGDSFLILSPKITYHLIREKRNRSKCKQRHSCRDRARCGRVSTLHISDQIDERHHADDQSQQCCTACFDEEGRTVPLEPLNKLRQETEKPKATNPKNSATRQSVRFLLWKNWERRVMPPNYLITRKEFHLSR